MSKRKLP